VARTRLRGSSAAAGEPDRDALEPERSQDARQEPQRRVPLRTVAREWTRIGVTGFGGPPAHIALLRALVVEREGWLDARAFEDANAACGLLPGPASTQLAIFCAYRAAGPAGAVVGGLGFMVPAVVMILALSVVFLAENPPTWVRGAGAGAGAAVPAVALGAGLALLTPSWERAREHRRVRWLVYLAAGIASAIALGAYLVLVLFACGLAEIVLGGRASSRATSAGVFVPVLRRPPGLLKAILATSTTGGFGALAWTAFKVGALSFGGGFVIIPLMQGDAVHAYHWMSAQQFLNAVALGQITPGPVVATVAAVGYAAHGIAGGVLAALVAFLPSFAFVLLAGRRFESLRADRRARAFLDGAGPAAIGAILGAAVTLAAALQEPWQVPVLAAAVIVLLFDRSRIVVTLLAAGAVGVIVALAGAPLG
jgi:chromate transporter